MHQQILESVTWFIDLRKPDSDTENLIQIPHCYRFIESENQIWWDKNLARFPSGYSPCNILESERIPPISQEVQDLLIDKYCPVSLKVEIKASSVNQDCLIRPYLGRRLVRGEDDRLSRLRVFSLRNFPLHVDQMEQLNLGADLETYAELMAEALAVIHWYGQIDANDVEFVLASPRCGAPSRLSNILVVHTNWLLDFDCCRRMSMDLDGVDQAVAAFFRNDPYYPRPDQPLWKCFRNRYLQTSSMITKDDQNHERAELPAMFIQKIQQRKTSCTNSVLTESHSPLLPSVSPPNVPTELAPWGVTPLITENESKDWSTTTSGQKQYSNVLRTIVCYILSEGSHMGAATPALYY